MITHPTHHTLIQAIIEWYQIDLGLEETIFWTLHTSPPYI